MVVASCSACAFGGLPVSTQGAPPRPRVVTASSVQPAEASVATISTSAQLLARPRTCQLCGGRSASALALMA
eukprot:13734153-Alexandrium_andersonii.AAC.1